MTSMSRSVAAAAMTIAAALAVHAAAQGTPSASDLAARIQAHYDTVHDFKAGFSQTYTSGALGQKTTERGDVKVKKPNRMDWTYAAPAKKRFIADGVRIFDYEPNPGDPSCTVTPIPTGDQIAQGILFLAGRGNLVKDFTGTAPATQPANAWQLDLVPKVPQDDFTALTVVVDRQTLALQRFVTVDRDGNRSQFDFSHLQENAGLKDSDFAFTPPRGVRCEAPRP